MYTPLFYFLDKCKKLLILFLFRSLINEGDGIKLQTREDQTYTVLDDIQDV